MASYLQKLRRQSKQMVPQWEPKVAGQESKAEEAPKVESTTTAGPSEATVAPPAPAARVPDEETDKEPEMDEEDKKFLERLAAIADEPEGQAPPLPSRPVQPAEAVDAMAQQKAAGRNAQEALMDGADKVPLPMSPPETAADQDTKGKGKATDGGKKSVLSYFSLPKFAKKDDKDKKKATITDKDRAQFADDLQAAAQSAKNAEPEDTRQEDKELTEILDQLNVSAVNNRVFSFSKESEELFNKFTQVLKDLVNGVPTAYDDLEKLFTDYDNQLKKMYGSLPPFLQNLVKSLPAKLTATLGPEILAASAEKPGFDAKQASGSKSKRSKIPSVPSLKSLISAQGAVATALRSIISFIKLRFPTLALGTNAIVSVAVFVLLFVFWYCHKRGRETRLEKERLAAEEAQSGQASSASSINGDTDSIFGSQIRAQKEQEKKEETPKAPLIINDGKEGDGRPTGVDDLPSVAHLPDPKAGEVPRTATPPPVSK